jgi:hypothetical protein
MKTFKDLEFKEHVNAMSGFDTQARLFFPNGFGVSVVTGPSAYSSGTAKYELAVLDGTEEDGYLTYTTPITDDVLGYLTEEDVTIYMRQVQEL